MFDSFYIDKIVEESITIKSFYLKRTDKTKLEPYLPGQFVTVQVELGKDKEVQSRNYTLSNSPGKGYYRLTIKREEHGSVSRYFHDRLNLGDKVKASKPTGNFYLSTESGKPVVLLSGGVGITPMLSMLDYILKNQPDRPVYFIHSSLSRKVQPFGKWLWDEIGSKMKNGYLFISHTYPENNEVKGLDYHHEGLLSKEDLKKILPQEKAEFYMCGPVGFMDAMYSYLTEIGVNEEDIFYEFFGEKKSLGNSGEQTIPQPYDTATYQVIFKESGVALDWNGDFSSILDLAEANGIEPLSSCRMGTCLTCETNLAKGTVKYDPEPFMDMPNDKILICCSKPTSDIEIDM